MNRGLTVLLLSASVAFAGTLPPDSRPSFLDLETPLQMAGQAGAGLLGAVVAGWIGAGIGSKSARRECVEETIDPDLRGECSLEALGGGLGGFMIGAPLGHALAAWGVGAYQDKHGAPVAALSALAGDAAMVLLAASVHSALDGKVVPYGSLDPLLISMTVAGMLAIPVATQSIWDYRVRIALQPGMEPGATTEENRYLLRIAEVKF